jgi:D-3-phosphoglycerate dehydrogenase / 2-oxoglutarate reductase
MTVFNVLIPDDVDRRALDILNAAEGLRITAPGKLTQEQLIAAVPEADGMLIRSGVKITPEVLDAATNLKVIARAGVGVDNVDLAAATAHGVVVVNTPGGNTISTAEHTFGLMLALARFLPQGDASLRAGKWDRKSFVGVELRGKTLGLIGCGRIGQAIAIRAKAFEMTVIGFDPYLSDEAFNKSGIIKVDLPTLYAQADFISLHTVINAETRGLINAASIAQMKDGVRILNAARGALINDADLAAALKSGKVAGAGLDVFEPEPPAADNPLIGLPNVIHTPHLAASTSDAQIVVALEAAELVRDFLLKNEIQNVCNPTVLEKKSL